MPVGKRVILFHTAFYSRIVKMLPEIGKVELIKYIPTTITHGIYHILDINRREITYDKYCMYYRMKRAGISIPEIYFVTDGRFNNIGETSADEKNLQKLSSMNKIIGKPRSANAGEGVYFYTGRKIKPNYVYQQYVENHQHISTFQGNDYCSTVRYVVYNVKDSMFPMGARIRINAGNLVDHAKTGTSCAIVNHKTGVIISDGFFSNGKTYQTHPVSGITEKGYKLPNWKMCLREIKKTCNEYRELPLIAFDIVITEDNCKILEINAGCGTLISQYQERWHDHQFVKDFYKNTRCG